MEIIWERTKGGGVILIIILRIHRLKALNVKLGYIPSNIYVIPIIGNNKYKILKIRDIIITKTAITTKTTHQIHKSKNWWKQPQTKCRSPSLSNSNRFNRERAKKKRENFLLLSDTSSTNKVEQEKWKKTKKRQKKQKLKKAKERASIGGFAKLGNLQI